MQPPTTVKVTADHIHLGVAKDCEKCPIALAIAEHTGPDYLVDVDNDVVRLWLRSPHGATLTWRATLPGAAESFISTFDLNEEPVEPFEFSLEWVPAMSQLPPDGAQ